MEGIDDRALRRGRVYDCRRRHGTCRSLGRRRTRRRRGLTNGWSFYHSQLDLHLHCCFCNLCEQENGKISFKWSRMMDHMQLSQPVGVL